MDEKKNLVKEVKDTMTYTPFAGAGEPQPMTMRKKTVETDTKKDQRKCNF